MLQIFCAVNFGTCPTILTGSNSLKKNQKKKPFNFLLKLFFQRSNTNCTSYLIKIMDLRRLGLWSE